MVKITQHRLLTVISFIDRYNILKIPFHFYAGLSSSSTSITTNSDPNARLFEILYLTIHMITEGREEVE